MVIAVRRIRPAWEWRSRCWFGSLSLYSNFALLPRPHDPFRLLRPRRHRRAAPSLPRPTLRPVPLLFHFRPLRPPLLRPNRRLPLRRLVHPNSRPPPKCTANVSPTPNPVVVFSPSPSPTAPLRLLCSVLLTLYSKHLKKMCMSVHNLLETTEHFDASSAVIFVYHHPEYHIQ